MSTVNWPDQTAGAVSIDAGRLAIKATTGYAVAKSRLMDANESGLSVKVTPAAISGTNSQQTFLSVEINEPNAVRWIRDAAQLRAVISTSDVDTTLATLTYSGTTHTYWRIRNASGFWFWDTSADGATWTQRATTAETWNPSGVYVVLMAGRYTSGDTESVAYFDAVNGG